MGNHFWIKQCLEVNCAPCYNIEYTIYREEDMQDNNIQDMQYNVQYFIRYIKYSIIHKNKQ